MEITAALVVVPFGLLFLLSGLIVNLIQATCFVAIRPFSKSLYRRINRVVAELLWLQLVWLIDWWAGVKIRLYADTETFQSMGKEHGLVICNHRSDIDWLVGWILAQRSGCLGSTLAVMKKSSKFLPEPLSILLDIVVIGWSMWFTEYLFLERSWAKDEKTLKSGLQRLKDFPQPFWLALFVEGTRFTQTKLLAAQEYASSQGLPIPKNVLIPRTKGFVSSVSIMRSFVPAVYDVTVAIPKDQPSPTMLRLLRGQPSVMAAMKGVWASMTRGHSLFIPSIKLEDPEWKYDHLKTGGNNEIHVHMKRHAMNELPQTDDGVAQWCKDIFVAKDGLLQRHQAEGTFGEEDYKPIGRPIKSLLVVIFWSSLLSFMAYRFFKWSSLLSTWRGIALSGFGVFLVTAVMHIFILFSQAERSTSAKASRSRVNKE